jgi:hypothetical protein
VDRTASVALSAVLAMLPVLASAQGAFQPPPSAFQTPSGNVHCLWGGEVLRCDVLVHDYAVPERPPGCTGEWGGRFEIGPQRSARMVCGASPVRNDESFVLGYGARWIMPGLSCEAEEAGLLCRNGEGYGLRLSRTRMERF